MATATTILICFRTLLANKLTKIIKKLTFKKPIGPQISFLLNCFSRGSQGKSGVCFHNSLKCLSDDLNTGKANTVITAKHRQGEQPEEKLLACHNANIASYGGGQSASVGREWTIVHDRLSN